MARDGVFDHGFPSKEPGFIATGNLSRLSEQHLVDCNMVDSACQSELVDNGFACREDRHVHGVQLQIHLEKWHLQGLELHRGDRQGKCQGCQGAQGRVHRQRAGGGFAWAVDWRSLLNSKGLRPYPLSWDDIINPGTELHGTKSDDACSFHSVD